MANPVSPEKKKGAEVEIGVLLKWSVSKSAISSAYPPACAFKRVNDQFTRQVGKESDYKEQCPKQE